MRELQSIQNLLREHGFFKGMRPEDLAFLASFDQNIVFPSGDEIFREGGPADHFYLIRHGKVALETFVPERGPLRIETITDGDVLGWSWLFPAL